MMEELNQTQITALACVIVFFVAAPVVLRWINERVEPSREELRSLGRALLTSPDLDERQKQIVSEMLDDALDWRSMIHVSWRLPYILLLRIFKRVRIGQSFVSRIDKPAAAQDVRHFTALHIQSVAAANPVFAIVVACEIAVLVVLLLFTGMIDRTMDFVTRSLIEPVPVGAKVRCRS